LGTSPHANNSLFISSLLSNFTIKKLFPWEHGNSGGEPYANNSLFLFPHFFPISQKRNISKGTWEHWGHWGGGGTLCKQYSLFIYFLTSFQFHKKKFKNFMGTWEHWGHLHIFRSRLQTQKIVKLSEACTKELHPKVLFLVQVLFLQVLLVVFLQCIITQ